MQIMGAMYCFRKHFFLRCKKEKGQGLSHPELLLGEKQELVLILLPVILLSIPPRGPTYL